MVYTYISSLPIHTPINIVCTIIHTSITLHLIASIIFTNNITNSTMIGTLCKNILELSEHYKNPTDHIVRNFRPKTNRPNRVNFQPTKTYSKTMRHLLENNPSDQRDHSTFKLPPLCSRNQLLPFFNLPTVSSATKRPQNHP